MTEPLTPDTQLARLTVLHRRRAAIRRARSASAQHAAVGALFLTAGRARSYGPLRLDRFAIHDSARQALGTVRRVPEGGFRDTHPSPTAASDDPWRRQGSRGEADSCRLILTRRTTRREALRIAGAVVSGARRARGFVRGQRPTGSLELLVPAPMQCHVVDHRATPRTLPQLQRMRRGCCHAGTLATASLRVRP